MITLATFNANNFYLRYKFIANYPGGGTTSEVSEAGEAVNQGYMPGLPFGRYAQSQYVIWDPIRRELAADALKQPDGVLPDILCLQEVENIHAIRRINDDYFGGHYRYSLSIDAYDPRNIDVAVLATRPLTRIVSHIDRLDSNGNQIFRSRDCLEFDVELDDGKTLTIFLNHLKSKFVPRNSGESDASYRGRVLASHQKRLAQANEVHAIIGERFANDLTEALYCVVGDFNDTPESPWLAPLADHPRYTNMISRHRAVDDRWTYYWRSKGSVSQIDYVLASRALRDRMDAIIAADSAKVPHVERAGLAYTGWNNSGQTLPATVKVVHFEEDIATPANPNATPSTRVPFRFQRYQEVIDDWRNNTSDHCPVKVWI